jgi:hypothetical protein
MLVEKVCQHVPFRILLKKMISPALISPSFFHFLFATSQGHARESSGLCSNAHGPHNVVCRNQVKVGQRE